MAKAPSQANAHPVTHASAEELAKLKRELSAYIAQKISLSLFTEDKHQRLRIRVLDLLNDKLADSNLHLDDETKGKVVRDILDGIPRRPIEGTIVPEETPENNHEEIYKDCLSYVAGQLSDDLFKPGNERRLTSAVLSSLQDRLDAQQIHDQVLRRNMIERILHRLNPALMELLPSFEEESAPEETADEVWEEEDAEEEEAEPDPTQLLTRDALYYLATNFDPAIFDLGDEKLLRREIERQLDQWPEKAVRPIPQEIRQSIIEDIVEKGTIQFQL